VIGVNAVARRWAFAGMPAAEAAASCCRAPGQPAPGYPIDRTQRVAEGGSGRVVLMASTSFATAAHRQDVLCVGSHGGRVNALPLLAVCPRGVISNDGGLARERSGVGGLNLLDEAGVAGAAVDAMSARIGDAASVADGDHPAVNRPASAAGGAGQSARAAAGLLLGVSAG
jgi:hypothetical protein